MQLSSFNTHNKGIKKHKPLKLAVQWRSSCPSFASLLLISGGGLGTPFCTHPYISKTKLLIPPLALLLLKKEKKDLPLFFLFVIHGHSCLLQKGSREWLRICSCWYCSHCSDCSLPHLLCSIKKKSLYQPFSSEVQIADSFIAQENFWGVFLPLLTYVKTARYGSEFLTPVE